MPRTEAEQLEFQRRNPDKFTTLTQGVNVDGTLYTYDAVTSKLRSTKSKLESYARAYAASRGVDPDYWFLLPALGSTKRHIDYIDRQLGEVLRTFVDNYARIRRVYGSDTETSDV